MEIDLGKNGTLKLREMEEKDKNFLMSSWLRSFKGSYYAGPIQNDMYWKVYQNVLERILRRKDVIVSIACNPKNPGQIFGYLVLEETERMPTVHWIYVKQAFRGFGIAKTLLEQLGVAKDTEFYYTFKVKITPSLLASWKGRFNPNIVRQRRAE
jgi:GNAT superfamily N-acetyltransferase